MKLKALAFYLLVIIASPAAGQEVGNTSDSVDEQVVETGATSSESNKPIEQITITQERSLLSIRNQIYREEETMYRLFNDLNDNDKFDIFCHRSRPTGSYISQRDCEPIFFSDLKRESSRFAISEIRQAYTGDPNNPIDAGILQRGLDLLESEGALRLQAKEEFEELSEEMLRIAMENPQYRAALERLATLKGEYGLARKLKLEN